MPVFKLNIIGCIHIGDTLHKFHGIGDRNILGDNDAVGGIGFIQVQIVKVL